MQSPTPKMLCFTCYDAVHAPWGVPPAWMPQFGSSTPGTFSVTEVKKTEGEDPKVKHLVGKGFLKGTFDSVEDLAEAFTKAVTKGAGKVASGAIDRLCDMMDEVDVDDLESKLDEVRELPEHITAMLKDRFGEDEPELADHVEELVKERKSDPLPSGNYGGLLIDSPSFWGTRGTRGQQVSKVNPNDFSDRSFMVPPPAAEEDPRAAAKSSARTRERLREGDSGFMEGIHTAGATED